MLGYIFAFALGTLFGIIMMCLLQINKDNE
jgi:hypothetical protein